MMEFGSGTKYLNTGFFTYTSAPASPWVFPASLRFAARVVPPLALLLSAALIVGAVLFYAQARQNDDRIDLENRQALRAGAEKFHLVEERSRKGTQEKLHLLEQLAGVKELKWEAEPDQGAGPREVQSIQDGNGRILGWLSWAPERPMTDGVARLLPLLVAIAAGLFGLGGVSFWQTRRIQRELADNEERAQRLSRVDPLTRLPNHLGVVEILERELARREADEVVTFIFSDLEGFRELNDSISRSWGDDLLCAVAARISENLPPRAQAGRLGRHKFVIILPSTSAERGLRFAQEIADKISRPFRIQGQGAQVTAAIGVAHAPHDGLSGDELIRHSILAMRAAKRANTGTAVNFEPPMETDLHERRFLESELRRALEEKALDVHYQTIVAAEGSRIIGVEALLRWNHPTRGDIPPMAFVPVAEQTGMMSQLGEFVMRRALKDAKRWPDLYIALNLSPLQLKDRSFFHLLSSILADTEIDPSRVVLEITEGVLIDEPEEMRKRLEELRGLGLRIALDDFGSGYSSLSYLQRFPFDKLKIDRGFVTPLGRSENSAVIIQAIVALGRALGLGVLVEGVETEEQRVLLRLAGCDEMQGFLFAKPASREVIDKLLLEAKLRGAGSAVGAMVGAAAVAPARASGF
jgi:diguanylate cyclase (GGDEF)-like protein